MRPIKAEGDKARLEKALNVDDGYLDNIDAILPRVVDRYRKMLENLETVLQHQVARARNSIKALVGGDIRLVPTPAGGLNAELRGDYAG